MKSLAFVLLVLVVSMVFTNIPSTVFADSQLDSLLRIANQARDNIKIRLSQLATVPDEINNLYKQGSSETDLLAQSIKQEDVTSVKQHFLAAMRLFKEASDKIPSSAPTIAADTTSVTDSLQLKITITRMEKDAEKLKDIASKNNVEIDFSEFNRLIQNARENLDAGKIDEVNKTLVITKQFLIDAHNFLSTTAKQRTQDRVKDFVTKQIELLDKLIAQAKENGLPQNIVDTLEATKSRLQKISDANEITLEVKGISSIKEKIDTSNVNRINAKIKQLEIKIFQLENNIQDNDSRITLTKIKDMFVELKQLVSNGKLDESIQKIKTIEDALNNLNTTSDITQGSSETNTPTNTAKVNAESDSKLERIKTKIQSLEEQANSLSEKMQGNDAAMKRLKRVFSLIEDAKSQLDSSPEKAIRTLNEVDKILRILQKASQD